MMTSKGSGSKRKCQGKTQDVHTATSIMSANATKSTTCIEYGQEVTRISSSIVSEKATGIQTTTTYGGNRGRAGAPSSIASSSERAYSGRPGKKSCTASSIASANATNIQTTHKGRQGKTVTTSIASAHATSSQTAYGGRQGKAVTTSIASANATSSLMANRGKQGKVGTTSIVSANATSSQTANRGRQGNAATTSIASGSANATCSQGAYRGRQGKVQTSSTFSAVTTQFQRVDVEMTSFGSKVVAEQGLIRLTSSSSTFRKGRK